GSVTLGAATVAISAVLSSAGGYVARFKNNADGSDVYLGEPGTAAVFATSPSGNVLDAFSPSGGTGVNGESTSGFAVYGYGSIGGGFASNSTSAYSQVGYS